jgi:hypothetical protein
MSNGIQQVFFTRLTDVHTSAEGPKETLGTIRFHGNKVYKYIRYRGGAGAVAAVAGNFCYYYAPGGTSTGVADEVTSDLSDSSEIGAGVLQAVIAADGYGWIQIQGVATLTTALTAGGDGDNLTPTGSTDGTLDLNTAVTDNLCAIAIDASARIVFVTCPF